MYGFHSLSGAKKRIEQIAAAAAGVGRPTNQRASTTFVCTLKRASRVTQQTVKNRGISQPIRPKACRPQKKASSAGATPKVIASASESYSLPNSLSVPTRRAIRPSSPSRMPATKTSNAPRMNSPSRPRSKARKPRTIA